MNCPRCNAGLIMTDPDRGSWFECGSSDTFVSAHCHGREPLNIELRQANARIRELEAKLARMTVAGNDMADWLTNPRNLGDDKYLAHAWAKAKESQP